MTKPDKALSREALLRIATDYLSRHASSAARLRQILVRRVDRQLAGQGERVDRAAVAAMVDPVVEALQTAGLVDDAAFAQGRARRLAGKGRPAWRIRAELTRTFGVDPEEAGLTEMLGALDPLVQATRWAARRRLGPFRPRDRAARRDRDIASVARAGFPVEIACAVIDGDGKPAGEADPPKPRVPTGKSVP